MNYNCFIRIENGQPVDHPITIDNFLTVFPDIDIVNLPDNYAYFLRLPRPKVGPYQIFGH
jgi:hypothetical protein